MSWSGRVRALVDVIERPFYRHPWLVFWMLLVLLGVAGASAWRAAREGRLVVPGLSLQAPDGSPPQAAGPAEGASSRRTKRTSTANVAEAAPKASAPSPSR